MEMIDYYVGALKKYATFTGRANRPEFWYFVLMNLIAGFVLGLLGDFGSFVNILYSIAVFIPGLAVSVRRMHDTNRSGWWLLINLIPGIGTVIFLILAALESYPNDNKYGSKTMTRVKEKKSE